MLGVIREQKGQHQEEERAEERVRAAELDRPWTKAPKPVAPQEVLAPPASPAPQPANGSAEPDDYEIGDESPDLRFD